MIKEREQSLPEARKEGLIVQHLSDEVLVYDQRRHKAHCLNKTAALVWQRCDGKTTVANIAEQMSKQVGATVGEEVAWLAIEELSKSGLMEKGEGKRAVKEGMSRREMMKRAGVAAAIGLPVVTSIVAPKAAQAATCRASGVACTTSAQCCSMLCSGSVCA